MCQKPFMHKSCDLTYGLLVTVILLRVGYWRGYLVGHRLQHGHLQAARVCAGVSPATDSHHFLPHAGRLACPCSPVVAQPAGPPCSRGPPVSRFLGSLTQDKGGCETPPPRGWRVCGGGGRPPRGLGQPGLGSHTSPPAPHCPVEGRGGPGRRRTPGVSTSVAVAALGSNLSCPRNQDPSRGGHSSA